MPKMFILRVNYADYAMSHKDAIAILDIASRMQNVKQNGYSGPYYPVINNPVEALEMFNGISLSDVEEPEQPDQEDKFTKATREIAPF
jgi:hypothetical protein